MSTYDQQTGVYSTIDPSEMAEYMKVILSEQNRILKKEEEINGEDNNK